MTPEQYAAAQAAITASLASYVRRVASLFTGPALSPRDWLGLLRILFPEVQRKYAESASLGRRFYDYQRALSHPELPRNERLLSEVQFEWFVKNMEPARKALSQADSPDIAVPRVVLTAVREVEMAARRQIIGAVKNDPVFEEEPEEEQDPTARYVNYKGEPFRRVDERVQGWARVATGRETCAWCLMLISRGAEIPGKKTPWYREAMSGGLRLDDTTAVDAFYESGGMEQFREDTREYMEEWHVGCDCMVVPVFDVSDWPGREQAQRAQQLWIDAGREADKLIAAGKSRTTDVNKETLNAMRRRLERGDLSMNEYAFAA